jgi:hypothetical protein
MIDDDQVTLKRPIENVADAMSISATPLPRYFP